MPTIRPPPTSALKGRSSSSTPYSCINQSPFTYCTHFLRSVQAQALQQAALSAAVAEQLRQVGVCSIAVAQGGVTLCGMCMQNSCCSRWCVILFCDFAPMNVPPLFDWRHVNTEFRSYAFLLTPPPPLFLGWCRTKRLQLRLLRRRRLNARRWRSGEQGKRQQPQLPCSHLWGQQSAPKPRGERSWWL